MKQVYASISTVVLVVIQDILRNYIYNAKNDWSQKLRWRTIHKFIRDWEAADAEVREKFQYLRSFLLWYAWENIWKSGEYQFTDDDPMTLEYFQTCAYGQKHFRCLLPSGLGGNTHGEIEGYAYQWVIIRALLDLYFDAWKKVSEDDRKPKYAQRIFDALTAVEDKLEKIADGPGLSSGIWIGHYNLNSALAAALLHTFRTRRLEIDYVLAVGDEAVLGQTEANVRRVIGILEKWNQGNSSGKYLGPQNWDSIVRGEESVNRVPIHNPKSPDNYQVVRNVRGDWEITGSDGEILLRWVNESNPPVVIWFESATEYVVHDIKEL